MGTSVYFLALLALLASIPSAKGNTMECYACTTPNADSDQTCVTDPEIVDNGSPIRSCTKEGTVCCTILRQELVEEPGRINSFSRDCQDECPDDGFTVIEDATFKTYQTYCSTPTCNIGTGDSELGSTGGGGGDGSNFCCPPGVADGAPPHLTLSLTLLLASSFALLRWL